MAPSSQSNTTLSQDAIHAMISGEAFVNPLVVRLFKMDEAVTDTSNLGLEFLVVSVCDRVHSAMALLPANLTDFLSKKCNSNKFDYIIAVEGYVTSAANTYKPVLILSNVKVLEHTAPLAASERLSLQPIKYQPKHVQGGNAGSFFAESLESYSDADLAGSNAVATFASKSDLVHEQLGEVSKLLAQHSAHMTLHSHATTESNNSSPESSVTNYIVAVKEFSSSQLDRQEASLVTHIERAQKAEEVVQRHTAALQAAISYKGDLTPEILCQWHSLLMSDGKNNDAGRFRQKAVRAGRTRFAPVDQIQTQVEKLCLGARTLASRLRHKSEDSETCCLDKITFVTIVMFALVDVHPFSDGNGRMARISANWALSKVGFPFSIQLFATRTQRQEYLQALQDTRRNTRLVIRGNVGDKSQASCVLNESFCSVGLMLPVVRLLLDRVSKACHELQEVVSSKNLLVSEEAEARAARRFREKAAEGNCIICFDEKPNIATLCCGKAVHLNCIAQWLSSKDSCPQCRAQMPTMERVAPAAPPPIDEQAETTTEFEVGFDDTTTEDSYNETTVDDHYDHTTEEELEIPVDVQHSDVEEEEEDTTSDHSTIVVDDGEEPDAEDDDANNDHYSTTTDDETMIVEQGTTTVDETTTMDDAEDDHHETTTTDSFDSTTEEDTEAASPPTQQLHPPICSHPHCRNRSALGCTNNLCGRCCVLDGYYRCDRHSQNY